MDSYASTIRPGVRAEFDAEVQSWIAKGWLKPWRKRPGGLIPLMAVEQPSKNKVLDFRELNEFIECHTGDGVAICDETLRRWRRLAGPLKIVDLKSAYLQIRVDKSLWPYQQVRYKGKLYCLTRLGFGLNCAQRIMMKILKEVLGRDERIGRATDHYVDDIIVREEIATAEEVVEHLRRFGLETKEPETLAGNIILGLQLNTDRGGAVVFRRGKAIPEIKANEVMTRRQLFSVCGKLTGHYPVAGWLRVACSFLKRVSEGQLWDDFVGLKAQSMLRELLERIATDDPVRGKWHVAETREGKVWCDASSIAVGVALEMGGAIVEDAAWLRKEDDFDAVLKGINSSHQVELTDSRDHD